MPDVRSIAMDFMGRDDAQLFYTLFVLFLLVNLVLIVIGTFFRGPNWSLVTPW